jgi:hypothetical protein
MRTKVLCKGILSLTKDGFVFMAEVTKKEYNEILGECSEEDKKRMRVVSVNQQN